MSAGETSSQEFGRIAVGIVADPGVPTEIAERLAQEMPDELRSRVAEDVDWRVRTSSEELPLGDDGTIDMAEKAAEKGRSEHWDLLTCLTDLPRVDPAGAVVADADTDSGAALASVPAIGWIRLLPYARRVAVHLVGLLARETLGLKTSREDDGYHAGSWGVFGVRVRQIPSSEENVDSNLVLPGLLGKMRLLFGMVRDNRPWWLVPGLSRAVAAGAGTAAFGVFFPSIWSLADSLTATRLILINFFAVTAMVGWLIVHNGLWESPGGDPAQDPDVQRRDAVDRDHRCELHVRAAVRGDRAGIGDGHQPRVPQRSAGPSRRAAGPPGAVPAGQLDGHGRRGAGLEPGDRVRGGGPPTASASGSAAPGVAASSARRGRFDPSTAGQCRRVTTIRRGGRW
ncbi:hypothetical protein [Saccharopolyspora mangrovi]|uniref:DUF2267 domain-containing protein n=1 Tax=Saccharopolyspora mangrovi TaxID=3082379 RepID=A0ABU6AIP0_9PSEU|nr:hypothetical protein [Saccharopolyspora sp. S2-29]MEB3371390.1 hypothetical protein [Saccharopolyspora sp. S2-29]